MAQVEGFEPPQDVNPLSVFKTDPFSRTWVMAQVEGFEPPQDVNPLSVFKTDPFSRTWVNLHHSNGGSGRNRTSDTRIFSPLLYRLSYGTKMAVWTGLEPATSAVTGRHSKPTELPDHLGCGRRI